MAGPDLFGWPCLRPRSLTMLGLKRRVKFVSSMEVFVRLFGRHVAMPGSVFWVAPKDAVDAELQRLCECSGSPVAGSSFRSALPAGMKTRLHTYELFLRSEFRGGQVQIDPSDLIYDLNQNPGFGGTNSLLPTLTQTCTLWSSKHGRTLTGKEHLLAMGLRLEQKHHSLLLAHNFEFCKGISTFVIQKPLQVCRRCLLQCRPAFTAPSFPAWMA